MGCDLDVDTDRIRQSAALLRRAADTMLGRPPITVPSAIDEHAAGGSAEGRQALRGASTRAAQGVEGADALADRARQLADLLTNTAELFERAEALCSAGG